MKIDRNWWKDAEEEIQVESSTQAALSAVFERRSSEVRERIAKEKRKRAQNRKRTITLEKMLPVSQVAEITGFTTATVIVWCKDGLLAANYIRGQWRIPESALLEFIERETSRRA